MRRLPDAAGQVRAHSQRYHAGGNQRRITAAGTTGAAGRVERMVGAAPDGIVGLMQVHRLGHIALADDDRTSCPEAGNDRGICHVDSLPSHRHAEARSKARHREAILHAHRDPGELSDLLARLESRLQLLHLRESRGMPRLDERVQRGMCFTVPGDMLGQNHGRPDLAGGHALRDAHHRCCHCASLAPHGHRTGCREPILVHCPTMASARSAACRRPRWHRHRTSHQRPRPAHPNRSAGPYAR